MTYPHEYHDDPEDGTPMTDITTQQDYRTAARAYTEAIQRHPEGITAAVLDPEEQGLPLAMLDYGKKDYFATLYLYVEPGIPPKHRLTAIMRDGNGPSKVISRDAEDGMTAAGLVEALFDGLRLANQQPE